MNLECRSFLPTNIDILFSVNWIHTNKNNLLRFGWESNYLFTDQLTVKSLTREGYFATVSQSGWAGGGGEGQLRGEDQLEGSVALTRCEDTPGRFIALIGSDQFLTLKCLKIIATLSKSCFWSTGNSFNTSYDDDDIANNDDDNDIDEVDC